MNKNESGLRKTYETIDILKIKSGNMMLKEEAYQLSNMLHKLTNALVAPLKNKNHELIYKVDNNVPRYLVGDSERLYQVLYGILNGILLQSKNSETILSLKIKDESRLLFSIRSKNKLLNKNIIKNIFTRSLVDVDLTLIKELISSMRGTLRGESLRKNSIHFAFEIPYIPDKENKSNKNELKTILEGKQAIVVDKNIGDTEIITEILNTLHLKVSFLSSEKLALKKPNLNHIDFLIIKAEYITKNVFNFFKNFDDDRIKIIVINSIYDASNSIEITSSIADAQLYSPLIVGDIEEVFKSMLLDEKKKSPDVVKEELIGFKILDVANVSRRDFQMFNNKSILIVENNFIDQQMMDSVLNASKMDVYKVENGEEALKFLDSCKHIDLIFMDINMPVMDGFQASSKIRKHKIHGNVPIVAVTGLELNYELEQMILAGITACIVKPYKAGQLYIALEKFLKQDGLNKVYIENNTPNIEEKFSILDVELGVKYARGEDFYAEMLLQTTQALKNSDVLVKDMIINDQLDKLKAFCVDTVGLSATIGGTSFVALLNVMLNELSKNQKDIYISEYISLYKEEWLILEEEIKRYLMK